MKQKIHKGDTVEVIAGNYTGKRGEVQSVIRKKNKQGEYDADEVYVVVSGVNMIKKHQRRTGDVRTQVGIIEREGPIHISKVMLVAPHANQPTRVGSRVSADGEKTRYSAKFDELID
ncbi:MAG: 50S ribosomal protein L24 [Caldilineales bacterium]|nr:50S ribosomal protein L24 [Caldilineales bacterium]MCW5859047.1 50S ribosomal protein L24 [Caldilineales bacterium]